MTLQTLRLSVTFQWSPRKIPGGAMIAFVVRRWHTPSHETVHLLFPSASLVVDSRSFSDVCWLLTVEMNWPPTPSILHSSLWLRVEGILTFVEWIATTTTTPPPFYRQYFSVIIVLDSELIKQYPNCFMQRISCCSVVTSLFWPSHFTIIWKTAPGLS